MQFADESFTLLFEQRNVILYIVFLHCDIVSFTEDKDLNSSAATEIRHVTVT